MEPLRCLRAPRSATLRSSSPSRCSVSFLWSGGFLGRRQIGGALAARISLSTSNWRKQWECGESGEVALPWTGSGARHGAQEIVTTDDPMVNGLLLYLRNRVELEDLVYPACSTGLRAFFPKAVDLFSVHDLDGATHDYLLHANLPKTILRGRWSDLRSARIYINDGLSIPAQGHLDPLVHARVLEFRIIFAECLTHFVALPLHPETVLRWGTWKDPRVERLC